MSEDPTFDEILRRCRQGDEDAASELVRLYAPEVRRYIRYRLTSVRLRRFLDSLDVCQSVFANFFVRLVDGQFDLKDPGQLQRLLRVMAGNRVRDHHRRQTAARRAGEPIPLGPTVDLPADQIADPAHAAETRDLVDVLRARLSMDERPVFDLWMGGADWPDIARQVGSSAEAARKRFTRSVDRVAKDMGWEELA